LLFGGKLVYLVPNDRETLIESNWRYTPSCQNPNFYQLLDKALQEHGDTLLVSDLSEFSKPGGEEFLARIDIFLFSNLPKIAGRHWREALLRLSGKKLILIAYEPPTVMQEMYEPCMLSCFSRVLTWDDSRVDNVKFFKFCYPYLLPLMQDVPSFSKKKFLTMVVRYKRAAGENELYSERLRMVRYFEKHPKLGFEFYGLRWPRRKFSTYRGAIPGGREGKLDILKHYRFCIAYENTKGTPGYITEKIFDCFAAGVVPIYWGASNIEQYIPKNCYILRENFASTKSLVTYLEHMTEAEYISYLSNARKFLSSPAARQFSSEKMVETILSVIEK